MNSDFLKRGIILPLIAALAAGLIAFAFLEANEDKISPFTNGNEILRFDDLSNNAEADYILKSKGELPVRYMNDYSRLINEGSLSEKSCKVSETGTLYVEIINANAGVLSDELTFSGESGELKFKRTGEETVSSEQEIFLISPQTKKSAVVYYRLKGENGISRSYKAVIYEEAA